MALLDRFEKFLDQVIPPPEEVVIAVRRGEALLGAGDSGAALRIAQSSRAVSPGYLRALRLQVDALIAQGRPFDALAHLDLAQSERALPTDLIAQTAELAAGLGDEARALDLEAHVRARLRGEDPAVARRMLAGARTLDARGITTAALRMARLATVADPHLAGAWLLLARHAADRGDGDVARTALDRAVSRMDPTDAVDNRAAGEVARALGDDALAAQCFRRAWVVGDDDALGRLISVLLRDGDGAVLDRVLARAPGLVGRLVRSLRALARDGARDPALDDTRGGDIPEMLWDLAVEIALSSDPSLAARWCGEAPDRPRASAVRAVTAAREMPAEARLDAVRDALSPALGDPVTRPVALATLRGRAERSWHDRLAALLDDLADRTQSVAQAPPDAAARWRSLRQRLDEPLRVLLLGEFSAGKSTFLNALIEQEVSPMGVLPTTAVVHWLRHGEPVARILDARGAVVEARVEDLAAVVARRRAQGLSIDRVEVSLPLPRLAQLELIDTPGFNAGDPEHERAVRDAFALADAAIWLFDARQAGRDSEVGPLREAHAAGLSVVAVLNKVDLCPDDARDTLRAWLAEHLGALAPCVAEVSARGALAAMRRARGPDADPAEVTAMLSASGWTSLLAWMHPHLVADRARWKERRVAWHALREVASQRASLAGLRAAHAARAARRMRLAELLRALRGRVVALRREARREAALHLRDQLRGLAVERDPAVATLVDDAVTELSFRLRARAFASLRAELDEVRALAMELDLVSTDALALLDAPVALLLDQAVREGVREARAPLRPRGEEPPDEPDAPTDPWQGWESQLAEHIDPIDPGREELDAMLEVAEVILRAWTAQPRPVDG